MQNHTETVFTDRINFLEITVDNIDKVIYNITTMDIRRTGGIDDGSGRDGRKAFSDGLTWEEAGERWRKQKKNSLWIKAALRSFREAGGFVPSTREYIKEIREIKLGIQGI